VPRNFLELDVFACLTAALLFLPFAFVPGYVAGWFTGLLDFRRRSIAARIVIAIPLSIGLTPALAYLAGRFVGMTAVWAAFGVLAAAFVGIVARDLVVARDLRWSKGTRVFAAIAAGWILFGLVSLVDLQVRDRLYFSVVSFDYSLRSAIVSSISRSGIPPVNPYFFPGHGEPLRYHYFWLIPCSLVNMLARPLVSARQAIIGGTLWCGLGLLAIIPLFLRFLHPLGSERLFRRSLIGAGLLAVTGLDLIPNLLRDMANVPLPDPEWWNNFQVSSWTTSVLWVPHATAALIAGLMAILLIWNSDQADTRIRRAAWMVLAALCLASCFGSSIYVGFVLGIAIAVWAAALLVKRSTAQAWFAAGAGILGVLAIARHLLDLRGSLSGTAGAGPLFVFHISDFILSNLFRGWFAGSMLRLNLVNALMLPLNYLLELGVFLLVALWTLRQWFVKGKPLNAYQLATVIFAGVSVAICTCLRSSVIANNDLGCRGFLLAQFVFLLWATDILDRKAALLPRHRAYFAVLLGIGVLGSVHEAVVLRLFPVASDAMNIPRQEWLSPDHNLGRRTYSLRAAYETLRTALPPGAVVQHNPNAIPGDLPYGLYADRQAVAETQACGVVFGGDPAACRPIVARLDAIFDGRSTREQAARDCSDLAISTILIKDTDPVWRHRNSWIWRTRPIVANRFVRAVPCGGKTLIGRTAGAPSSERN
jgi:hypothetical protein